MQKKSNVKQKAQADFTRSGRNAKKGKGPGKEVTQQDNHKPTLGIPEYKTCNSGRDKRYSDTDKRGTEA